MWEEIDEQQFPADLRQRLGRNGFRIGVIGGQTPEPLVKLLALKDKPVKRDAVQQANAADMEADPHPLRHLQMRAGHRSEIVTSGVYDSVPLLMTEGGELRGQSYAEAQGIFAAKAFPLSDGRVRWN